MTSQAGPGSVEQRPGVDVCGEETWFELQRFTAELDRHRIAERVRQSSGDDQYLATRTREQRGSGRSESRLTDASLAREHDDAHEAESNREMAEDQSRGAFNSPLQPLESGVDDHLLGLAAQHSDHRDVQINSETVGDSGLGSRPYHGV